MTLPQFEKMFPYVMEIMQDDRARGSKEISKEVSLIMNLSEEDYSRLLPSKTQTAFSNRVQRATYYLKRAGLLGTIKRGIYQISDRGKEVIENKGTNITINDLKEFESFIEFITPKSETKETGNTDLNTQDAEKNKLTPEDQINEAIEKLNQQLADNLLEEIMNMSPQFFEKLVLDLLISMGYGGNSQENIIKTPYSQDDGIDGLIKEDALGLDYIYVQAKRWQPCVGQPEIQKFSGALSGQAAKKGVFITTSRFSAKAIEYAKNHQASKIVLIDGKKLAELMISYNVGVSTEEVIKLKRIDSDYFDENLI